MRRQFRRLFMLPLPLVPLADLPCALLLIQCLRTGETGPIAHAAYLLSTWALVVTIVAGVRLAPRLRRSRPVVALGTSVVAEALRRNPMLSTRIALVFGGTLNLLYAGVKLAMGVARRSVWFTSLGAYYLVLGGLRYFILRSDRHSPIGRDRAYDLRRCRLCGVILLAITQLLIGVVIQAATSQGNFDFPGPLIYAMALYTFAININAAVKLVRFYRRRSPMLTASRAVTLTAALVSLLSLEVALVDRFGDDDLFRRHMTAVLGGCICAAVLAMALSMIVRATRALRRLEAKKAPPTAG